MRSPAAKPRHTVALAAVTGGVQGRSALAVALMTVSGLPLTVIRAPSTGSTDLTWLSFLSLARSAAVTLPGPAAMRSGTTRRGTLEADAAAVCGTAGAGLAAATEPATAMAGAGRAPAPVAGRDVRRILRSLTVPQLYRPAPMPPRPRPPGDRRAHVSHLAVCAGQCRN